MAWRFVVVLGSVLRANHDVLADIKIVGIGQVLTERVLAGALHPLLEIAPQVPPQRRGGLSSSWAPFKGLIMTF